MRPATQDAPIRVCDQDYAVEVQGDHVVAMAPLADTSPCAPRGEADDPKGAPHRLGEEALRQLHRFLGDPSAGFDLPLRLDGTPLQAAVWRALMAIPVGETRSYTELAVAIGRPKACRAVAQACAKNRLAYLVPCHRAVRQDGSLGGFRWGLRHKQELLDRERRLRHITFSRA